MYRIFLNLFGRYRYEIIGTGTGTKSGFRIPVVDYLTKSVPTGIVTKNMCAVNQLFQPLSAALPA